VDPFGTEFEPRLQAVAPERDAPQAERPAILALGQFPTQALLDQRAQGGPFTRSDALCLPQERVCNFDGGFDMGTRIYRYG